MEHITVLGLLVPLFFAVGLPSAGAQTIPTPVDDVVDQVEDTAGQVVETVEGTADEAVETTEETTASSTGGGGGGQGSTGGTSSGTGDVGGTSVSSSTSGTQTRGDEGSGAGGGPGSAARGDRAQGKGSSGRATVRASVVARPQSLWEGLAAFPVLVVMTNDADGDGSFHRNEIASEPRADVRFRIAVRNGGSNPATLLGLNNYVMGESEVLVRRNVCTDVAGTTIDPGATAVCAFTLPGHAPPDGEVKVNTAAATIAVDDGTAGAGAVRRVYASCSVQTGSPDVLGLVLRNPESLARTGAAVLPLLAAAVFFAGIGAELLRAGRRVGLDPEAVGLRHG